VVFEFQFGQLGGAWLVGVHEPHDKMIGRNFGRVMAQYGDLVVIGAPGGGQCGSGVATSGAAYVFQSTVLGLVERAKLTPPQGEVFGFGRHVAFDGGRALVGTISGPQGYEVHVFEAVSPDVWVHSGAIVIPFGAPYSFWGGELALRGDDAFVATEAGYLHFRRRTDGTWSLIHTAIHGATSTQAFPIERSIFATDDQILVGCPECFGCFVNTGGLVGVVDRNRLLHGRSTASIASVGTQDFFLDFGLAGAGRFYFTLGSVSGTSPGIALPNSSDTLPLVFDAYTSTLLDRPTLTITNGWGVLDELGRADAQFRVPNGLDPSFAGLVLHHAAVTLDPVSGALAASNAVAVELVP
jgi:hypothetical protein